MSPIRSQIRLALANILKDEDYRHRLRLERAEASTFFAPEDPTGALLAERRHWMAHAPDHHVPFLPEAAPLVDELATLGPALGVEFPPEEPVPSAPLEEPVPNSPLEEPVPTGLLRRWIGLASRLEPDVILLTLEGPSSRMVAGAVCFPSSWRPEEKLGLPLAAIHGVVPGLNAEIGDPIDAFLGRLRPGTAWLRANWGLTASPELNQHPARALPRLAPQARLETTLLRLERQALLALPRTGAILFGIRIEHVPLIALQGEPTLAHALARALSSMPERMSRYKGLHEVRENLVRLLSEPTDPVQQCP